jgi:hypothetical protein
MLIAEVAEASRCSEVLLKKARVLAIGLPGKIKSIVNEGMLQQEIDSDIRYRMCR